MKTHGRGSWPYRLATVGLLLGGCRAGGAGEGIRYAPNGERIGGITSPTFSFPRISTGFAVPLRSPRVTPTLKVEALRHDFRTSSASLNVGAGADLFFLDAAYSPTRILDVEAGLFGGYDFREDEATWGIDLTISKF